MRANFNTYLLIGLLLIIVFSCKKDEEETTTLSSEKAIISFKILDIPGTVNESAKAILVNVPNGTNLSALTPQINISPKASINPNSGESQDFTNAVLYTVTAEDGSSVEYSASVTDQCANAINIYSFTYDGKNYEIIKENKTWVNAAACAVERGGYLAEINDEMENTALFNELTSNASLIVSNTSAFDGGDASYVWIGGNDIATEGEWMWDGDYDGTGNQFWLGDASGSSVNGLYNNWGNEPDNYGSGQNCLGLALTEWPLGSGALGVAGQWNDVSESNSLYYIVEYD